jgi:hypothetical protein
MSRRIWIGNDKMPLFEDVVRGLQICVKTCLWPMCTSLFSVARTRKPWFEEVVRGLAIYVKTDPWPMCISLVARVHEHENHGLKMLLVV